MATKTTPDTTPTAAAVALDPKTFDVEAWLTGATLPQATVELCANQAAKVELDALIAADDADDRMVSPYAARIAELRDIVAAATVPFTVRAISPSEAERIDLEHPIPNIGADQTPEQASARVSALVAQQIARVAAQIVEPALNAEQVGRLRNSIGDAAFNALFATCTELNEGRLISPPTSRGASTTGDGS